MPKNKMNLKVLFILSIMLFNLLFINLCSADDIVIYDLRYTLTTDVTDPVQVNKMWDHCHAVSTLEGVVNRDKPRLYVLYVNSQVKKGECIDEYWLNKYRQDGKWLGDRKFIKVESISELLDHFKDEIKGAVVYDPNVYATSNVASAVAGADDLIAIRYDNSQGSLYSQIVKSGPELEVKVWLVNQDGSSKFTGQGLIPDTQRYTTNSPKCDVYIWMMENYMKTGKLNMEYGAYYIDYYWTTKPNRTVINQHTLSNHDFFVSQKAFFFDLNVWADEACPAEPDQIPGTDRRTMQELLHCAYKLLNGAKMIHIGGFPPWAHKYTKSSGSRHPDVSTEWEYCSIISAYNAFKDADAISFGAMANASFWQHFPLKEKYPQEWLTRDDLKKRGYLTEEGKVNFDGKEFVVFYVGDYDSASWLYQRTMDIWDHPQRGEVPMMWSISPIIAVRAPMAMDYLRETAKEKDYFVAADNGAGYLNPGNMRYSKHLVKERPISGLPNGLKVWQEHCSKYYKKWGLTVSGFVIDGFAQAMDKDILDAYKIFSPNGTVIQKGPISYLHKNMPVIRSDYDIQQDPPSEAAKVLINRINARPIPFHWFRNILKGPDWYVQMEMEMKKLNPKLELLDAPTFFELYRIYLENHSDAAVGKYPYFESRW